MTYRITQQGERWLIYAEGLCILDCEDQATALATVAAARTLLQQPPRASKAPAFTSLSRPAHEPEAITIAARCG